MSNFYFLDITQNINFNITLTAQNSNGTAINLTGQNLSGYIRPYHGSTGILYSLFVTPDPSYISGIVYISGNYPYLNSSGFVNPIGAFPFDVISVNSGGYETLLLYGKTNIWPINTR